ncbi:MAG: bifunctional phosphoribosylaminoimidazolecarboxamide formyltransferase/IMP cyclohydrolase, partial [Chloroflexales bacterium]|nr:bifunctional phosphoribosylaminoimidazolecarboxamide formyltransferase/IMP cyclohydrolase [Chloroflexales bacterium]
MRALISVSNKRGVVEFAGGLAALGYEIVSTGNTHRTLIGAGIPAQPISDVTGFPEILDGRVKTLHPAIHGGILARRDLDAHRQQLETHGITLIDLVVSNLYPFADTITRPEVTFAEAIEDIDIGGVALTRAAAKNHEHVLIIVDPDDYVDVLAALQAERVTPELRRRLAAKAFAHTAAYDAMIANYLADEPLPATLTAAWPQAQRLRYGENPHQQAALYGDFGTFFAQLHGKELSYINILDIAAAQELAEEFAVADGVALAIIKHTNPCGVGLGATPLDAWEKAFATDREAPFGGIIALNAPVDEPLAQRLNEIFTEIIVAPDFAPAALALLRKKRDRRLMRALLPISSSTKPLLHSVPGGVLAQQPDRTPLGGEEWRVVTRRAPTSNEERALRFAWRVCKHVKSNAIVYAAADRTLGVGAGQMSRVDSSRLAVWKAGNAGISL